MNFKNYFNVINDVHKRCGKSRIYLFFDSIICGIKYQAGYMDYQLFEMYKMNAKERKTIVTRGKNNAIISKYNNPDYRKYFNDKDKFNEKFDKYLNRSWLILNEDNYNSFKNFIKDKEYIIAKPFNGACGKGVEKVEVRDCEVRELYNRLVTNQQFLVEEVARQCKTISDLHPNSINTIRVVTLKGQVVVAYLRIGNCGYVVDNLNHGGLAAPVDVIDGIIKYPAMDKNHNVYKSHPLTNKKIVGLKIPMWNKIIGLCEKAAKEIPEVGYVGWDVCVGEDKPFLIEGNDFPGHDIYQLPPHRDGNIGLYPLFESIMKGDEK